MIAKDDLCDKCNKPKQNGYWEPDSEGQRRFNQVKDQCKCGAIKRMDYLCAAEQLCDNAMNKISNPIIGCVVVTPNGYYKGVNIFVSNCTLFCAEAVAIASAVSAGDRNIQQICIVSKRVDGTLSDLLYPCGNCRQIIHDLAPDATIAISNTREVASVSAKELLGNAFKSSWLRK